MEYGRIVTLILHVHVQEYVDPVSHVLGGDGVSGVKTVVCDSIFTCPLSMGTKLGENN